MAVGWPTKTTYANGDVYSASDVNDTNGTLNLAAGSQYAAAKNFIINGGFDIWQRGTSFSVGAFSPTYTADRWTTFNAAACTISQETSTVPTGSNYALKLTGGATTTSYDLRHGIESLNAIVLANQIVTVSCLVTGTTGKTHNLSVQYSTSVNPDVATGTWTDISPSATVTVTSGTFSTLKTTVTIPSTSKSVRVELTTDTLTSGQTFILSNVQLEINSVATVFARTGGTIQGELAACQRYYYRANANGTPYGKTSMGGGNSSTAYWGDTDFPVAMRVAPTSLDTSSVGNYRIFNYADTVSGTPSAINIDTNITTNTNGRTLWTTSGLSANVLYYSRGNNTANSYLGFSAEL